MVRFITVEREYGSQGAEFAGRLAERLGWELLDTKLVDAVARRANVPQDVVQVHDEQIDPWYQRLGRAFWHGNALSEENKFDGDRFIDHLRGAVREAASRENCVIVGRGAPSILANVPGAFHIFVFASLARKIRWVTETFPDKAGGAEAEVLEMDRRRASYIRRYYGHAWDDPHLYHLMLNSCMGQEAMLGAALEGAGLRHRVRAYAG